MARKKPSKPLPTRVQRLIDEAVRLANRKEFDQVAGLLDELEERAPDNLQVAHLQAQVAWGLKQHLRFLDCCERIVRLDPTRPESAFQRAYAFSVNNLPVLSLRSFEQAVARWPQHPTATSARKAIELLRAGLPMIFAEFRLEGDDALEAAARYEHIQLALVQGDTPRGVEMAQKMFARWPRFVPVLSLLADTTFVQGQREEALTWVRRALDVQPDNGHALSVQVEVLVQLGRTGEAWEVARGLLTSANVPADAWARRLEALSYLGDDAGVLELFTTRVAPNLHEASQLRRAQCFNYAATAAARRGDEVQARLWWRASLAALPSAEADENLKNLDLTPDSRETPFAHPLMKWLTLSDLTPVQDGRARLALLPLVQPMLERGTPHARSFLLRFAAATADPALIGLLREFVAGKQGAFRARVDVLQALVRMKAVPHTVHQVWDGTGPREVQTLGSDIHDEPTGVRLPPQAEAIVLRATVAGEAGNDAEAEALYRQALGLTPPPASIGLEHNIQALVRAQGREAEADALLAGIVRDHPDYFFGQAETGMKAARAGDLDRAREILKTLGQRPRLHVTEAVALGILQFEVAWVSGDRPAAETALVLVRAIDPTNYNLPLLHEQLLAIK